MVETVEVRCPVNPGTLLTKLLFDGGKPHITDGNLIELACDRCKEQEKKRTGRSLRFLHRYDLLGNLIETVTEPIKDPRRKA